MRVARFQWPADMTAAESALTSRIESQARYILGGLALDPNASHAFEALDLQLFAAARFGFAGNQISECTTLGGRIRIVTAEEYYLDNGIGHEGIRVGFTWTRAERERRDEERRRATAPPVGLSRPTTPHVFAYAPSNADDAIYSREGRTLRRRSFPPTGGRVVGWEWRHSFNREPFCELDLVTSTGEDFTAELARGEERPEVGAEYHLDREGRARRQMTVTATATYHAHVEIERSEIERSRTSSDLDLMSDQISVVEAIARIGLEVDGDAARQMLGLENPFTSTVPPPPPPPADREFRREVQGEWTTVADASAVALSYGSPEASIARVVERIDEITHPVAVMFVGFLRDVPLKDFLRGHVARQRDGEGNAAAPGNDEEALRAILADRRPGDAFYFVPAMAAAGMLPALKFEHDPGSLGARIQEARTRREREAVDLLVRIVNVALAARERAYSAALAFHSFARAALGPWAASPSPVELDVEYKPFGVDLSPAADSTAARFALLELK